MLELMGRGYVIEHCISTFNNIQESKIYRMYVSEMLRALARRNGIDISVKYSDLIERKQEVREPESSAEVIDRIKTKLEKVKGVRQ